MNKRLQEIFGKIAEFEKGSPYNFCDRWCERCVLEKKIRCRVYHEELEQRMISIAHGRDERDPEITRAVMEQQFEEAEEGSEELVEENEMDLEAAWGPEFEKIKQHIEFVENHPLPLTAEEYRKRAHALLESAFYQSREKVSPELTYDFETVAWYHTLLPVKLERGLAGFHEPASEGDLALYDAVGQFEICKKAIRESANALRRIRQNLPAHHRPISELLALLHNLYDRFQALEESV